MWKESTAQVVKKGAPEICQARLPFVVVPPAGGLAGGGQGASVRVAGADGREVVVGRRVADLAMIDAGAFGHSVGRRPTICQMKGVGGESTAQVVKKGSS